MSEPLDGWARWLHKERFGGDETVARNLLAQLGQLRDRILRSARLKAGEVFLDVPSVNSEAVALAHDHGLAPVFETARMYTGAIRPVRLERVFGVTTFELG